MIFGAVCPYLDKSYTDKLDQLLENVEHKIDKIQQLVFHLQKEPGLSKMFTPEDLFHLSDDEFTHLVEIENQDVSKSKEIEMYYKMINIDFKNQTGAIKCPECQTGSPDWHVVQLRSADESGTVFLCLHQSYVSA